jgi:hypothetical protein
MVYIKDTDKAAAVIQFLDLLFISYSGKKVDKRHTFFMIAEFIRDKVVFAKSIDVGCGEVESV